MKTPAAQTRAAAPASPASYCRISSADDELGVRRQQKENAERAERAGWPKLNVYVDNDVSAYNGKHRPEYERLVEGIRTGAIDGLVIWHFDRLYRSPNELEALIDLLDARPRFPILVVTSGDVDLSTATGRMMARTLTNLARYEAEHRAERMRSKHRELALAGKLHGAGTRPFGYKPDRIAIDREEAKRIREAAKAVLAGATVRSICAEWNRRGVSTVTGTPWTVTVLRRVLLSPRVAGLREHRSEVVGEAVWEGIIDRTTHERLVALLTDPRRNKVTRPATRYLLTGGLGRCGVCGAKLVARPKVDGRRCYVCATGPGFSGCGKIRQLADPLERHVLDRVLWRIDTPELALAMKKAAESESEGDIDDVVLAEQQLAELAALWAAGEMTRPEWLAARRVLETRLEQARESLSRSAGAGAIAPYIGRPGVLGAAWDELDLDRKRAVVAAVVEKVVVGPAVKGRNFFDPERVEIVYA